MPAFSVSNARSGRSWSGMLTLWAIRPVSNSMIDGNPTPTATACSSRRSSISPSSWATSASASETSVLTRSRVVSLPSWSVADAILVPPTSRPMNWPSINGHARARSPEWPLERARRRLVEEDEQRAVLRAHAGGRRLGVRAVAEAERDRLRLVLACDENVDLARPVEHGKGQRHPRNLGIHAGDRNGRGEARGLLELRLAREQRGDVAVGAHPEEDEVEARPRPEVLAQQRVVGAGRGLEAELALDAHHARWPREPREQRAVGHAEVRVLVVGRDAALVGEPHGRAAPVRVALRGEGVGAARRRAAGEDEVAALLRDRAEPLLDRGPGILDDRDLPHPRAQPTRPSRARRRARACRSGRAAAPGARLRRGCRPRRARRRARSTPAPSRRAPAVRP